ncbi:hypothetical protein PtB15_1B708 [Puccinia triticina]|nr:hypothetical protein PtB15_1B708 [Puccinia triticina]
MNLEIAEWMKLIVDPGIGHATLIGGHDGESVNLSRKSQGGHGGGSSGSRARHAPGTGQVPAELYTRYIQREPRRNERLTADPKQVEAAETMLIGLIGPRGAGKKTIAEELVRRHSFRLLSIDPGPAATSTMAAGPEEEKPGQAGSADPASSPQIVFSSAQELLDFSTSNWTHHFVTLDLRSKADIVPFVKRPSFVLVFVQARLLDRWARTLSIAQNPSSL